MALVETDITTIRSVYHQQCIEYPDLTSALQFVMQSVELEYIEQNMHRSFALFSEDNVAIIAPTYNCLNTKVLPCNIKTEQIDIACNIMYIQLKKKSKQFHKKSSSFLNKFIYRYRDIDITTGIVRKEDLLNTNINKFKLSYCDIKLLKLTPSIIENLKNLTTDEKEIITQKIKKLKTIAKKML